MTASVGSTTRGTSRSSTRTSRVPCMTTPRMVVGRGCCVVVTRTPFMTAGPCCSTIDPRGCRRKALTGPPVPACLGTSHPGRAATAPPAWVLPRPAPATFSSPLPGQARTGWGGSPASRCLVAAPQLARWLSRSSGTTLVASVAMGAFLLVVVDLLAQRLLAPVQVPVGLVRSACGGFYLLWPLGRRGDSQSIGAETARSEDWPAARGRSGCTSWACWPSLAPGGGT
ncbi:iron chelate uptake ABC transporter family permease subunit [Actinomyces wuliandei]|uniref:iron chelate uptake ABC transporter family permease subunit n=1 Tax=Actinomyces wuliandei TaxID=2057743 RepID=UPI003530D3B0